MTHWSLRLARADDAAHLPAIERSAAGIFALDETLAPIMAAMPPISAEAHRRHIARGRCLVAEVGGEIAGFLTAQPAARALHIAAMSVAAQHQRRGIGEGLVRAAIIDAGNSGFASITLTTFADTAWNAPFYRRLGFVKVADLAAHPRLAECLAQDARIGLPADRRIAMIRFIT